MTVEKPRAANLGGTTPGKGGKQAPAYTPVQRETAGLRILQLVLAEQGIGIEDSRNEPTGADCIGTDGRYYELKVHGGSANGPLQLSGSEVLQARELGDRYVLVVIENVEGARAKPRVTFVPSPLTTLKVDLLGKVEVTGYNNEVFEQFELTAADRAE